MPLYTQESLEELRARIDLVDVLSLHVTLKRTGSSYKALCPFHEERTPSFCLKAGDTHYHCYGCGAHGDAISFLMSYRQMSFTDAVEMLAERFHVRLVKTTSSGNKVLDKGKWKEALARAAEIYHGLLLFSEEGRAALEYLYKRGLDADFIRKFQIGYAPKGGDTLYRALHALKFDEETMRQAGLLQQNKKRDFFIERIAFPICDATQAVIGFSCRKFKETTYGGKYINTPETPLFKKSRMLFGLHASRMRIAKQKRALIVEGQIDALRLIYLGFDWTVATLGTAFTDEHVQELLHLGVREVVLAMDGDAAGQKAAVHIGDLFQSKGLHVKVIGFPEGYDPDQFLLERGPKRFTVLLENGQEYLSFLYRYLQQGKNALAPAEKSQIVKNMAERIRKWEDPILVHESLRILASLSQVPESMLGIERISLPMQGKSTASIQKLGVDPNRILEADLFRWFLLASHAYPEMGNVIRTQLSQEHFRTDVGKRLFQLFSQRLEKGDAFDLLCTNEVIASPEDEKFLQEILARKVNVEKAKAGVIKTIEELLKRRWMEEKELIRVKLTQEALSEEEAKKLVLAFAQLNKRPPKVQ